MFCPKHVNTKIETATKDNRNGKTMIPANIFHPIISVHSRTRKSIVKTSFLIRKWLFGLTKDLISDLF
jgi:hypothetical protein